MRLGLVILFLFLSAGVVRAQEHTLPEFGAGSSLFWVSAHEGGSDHITETLIAQGDGFEIFRSESEYSGAQPADHFAVFHGISVHSCQDTMPSARERAALARLWPLSEGDTLKIGGESPATIQIKAPTEFFLKGQTLPAHQVEYDYHDNSDFEDEALVVLDDIPLTVVVKWSEVNTDRLTLVRRPNKDRSFDLNRETIGNCASLLAE